MLLFFYAWDDVKLLAEEEEIRGKNLIMFSLLRGLATLLEHHPHVIFLDPVGAQLQDHLPRELNILNWSRAKNKLSHDLTKFKYC